LWKNKKTQELKKMASVTQNGGSSQQFDNPAFEGDNDVESGANNAADTTATSEKFVSMTVDNHNTSVDTSTASTTPMASPKTAEAVNLEVVNFTSKDNNMNGSSQKNGTPTVTSTPQKNGKSEFEGVIAPGTDLDPDHPDDEYFVSSNNRKKCMRSVT
jgi:hypothetical protein